MALHGLSCLFILLFAYLAARHAMIVDTTLAGRRGDKMEGADEPERGENIGVSGRQL